MDFGQQCGDNNSKLSEYLDGTLDRATQVAVEKHVAECRRCSAILEGMRNVVSLASDKRLFHPPADFSSRLYSKLDKFLGPTKRSAEEIPIGITNDMVPLGSHLIHFWQNQDEFARGVRFLYPAFERNEYCIIFGHDEVLERVQQEMSDNGYDPLNLIRERRLTVLRRYANAQATIAEISGAIEAALQSGAPAVRFLGNLGIGSAPLPAGEEDVLDLEAKADALLSNLPVVIVCMYDIRSVPGRLIIQGGLEKHNLSICDETVRENPFYVSGRGHGPADHLQ